MHSFPIKRQTYSWPKEVDAKLKELHATGMAYSKIADELNKEYGIILGNHLTKNSISGKIKRMGLSNPERKDSLRFVKRKRNPPDPIESRKKLLNSLFELKNMQCRWVNDDVFCGEKVVSYAQPYCECHYKRVYKTNKKLTD